MDESRSNPDQYQLRFPPGMRERIKEIARANNRSMNAEILARLEADDPTTELIEDMQRKLFEALSKLRNLEAKAQVLEVDLEARRNENVELRQRLASPQNKEVLRAIATEIAEYLREHGVVVSAVQHKGNEV